jgi:hypothetical protein
MQSWSLFLTFESNIVNASNRVLNIKMSSTRYIKCQEVLRSMNALSRTLLATLATSLIACSDQTQVGQPSVVVHTVGGGKERPSKQTTHLVVNTDDSYRNVTKKSEFDGLAEISNLIGTSGAEEEWMFAATDQTWYEDGVGAKSDTSLGGFIQGHVWGDPSGLESIIANQKEITFYHFHPIDTAYMQKITDSAYLKVASKLAEENKEGFYQKLYYLNLLIPSVPSSGDIRRMARMLLGNRDSPVKLNYRVVSFFGIFDYTLTDEGLKAFKTVDDPAFKKELLDFDERYQHCVDEDRFDLMAWFTATNFNQGVRSVANTLSSQYVKVTYTAPEDIPKK